MFSDLLKSVANHHEKGLPFAVYRKPKEVLVQAILQEDTKLNLVKDFSETGFVFAPFDSDEPAILLHYHSRHSAEYIPKNKIQTNYDVADDISQKEVHIDLVKKGMAQIGQGDFKKVVLSRRIETSFESTPFELLLKLLESYPTAFCYLWHHPEIGTWLGATPEILMKIENQRFTTMSLAGTQKYVENAAPEWGSKELQEQQMVTDYISSALQNSVSNLNIGERESVRAGNLWHLRTKLSGRVEKSNFANIIHALHPTPAVCGLPMGATKKFILENENYNREYYTGFLGELNFKEKRDRSSNSRNQENKAYRSIKQTTTLFVNLRCMQLKESNALIYVGGGVTHDSDAEKEWQETMAKSKTMLQIVNKN